MADYKYRGDEAFPSGGKPAKDGGASAVPGDWRNPANWTSLSGAAQGVPESGDVVLVSAAKDKPESNPR